ncbi:MAG TPA: chloride channel protein [Thermoanaerobaculaceae bacterium]|nr:chloride channel protein [Thermoanaerobaculaceae bacterium]
MTHVKRAVDAPDDAATGSARAPELGDFTATRRMLLLSMMAMAIGAISAFVALALLRLIGLFTNLFFYQRLGTALVPPSGHQLGPLVVLVPVVGALIIGVMARYGSERIRGHGIPEAIEAILMKGSRVEPRLAILKPLSSAISIGSGGPFGAEGPIIMTGGAFGSMIAQFLHLTSAERRTLLVAGAAGGMSATFAAPVAAAVLAFELLLFEWKPRSFVPVALASATAAVVRRYLLGPGPLFATVAHPLVIGPVALLGCLVAGLLAGVLSTVLTKAVYASEDAFGHLPIHWMWWPALGGVVIGLGGLVFPQALGIGYEMIAGEINGTLTVKVLLGVLVVKSVIWAVSLGSGTSGGVLAPLLMMGGALGGLESLVFPNEGAGFWALVSMGAILGGTMRSPLTGIVFVVELTHDVHLLVPLLLAVLVAHGFTVLGLPRSILTEKVARRGYHLSREYSVDPLEIVVVRDAMRTDVVAIPAETTVSELADHVRHNGSSRGQRLYPVVDGQRSLMGVVTRRELHTITAQEDIGTLPVRVTEVVRRPPVVAYPDEPLRAVAYRMAEKGLTTFPVVERGGARRIVGLIALRDLLMGRSLNLEAENRRERVLRLRMAFRQPAPPPAERR